MGVSLLWPALHLRSYVQHRTAALAALRLLLFALPFNYKASVLDAMSLGTAALQPWALHVYNLLMGESWLQAAVVCSLGWLEGSVRAVGGCGRVHWGWLV